MIQHLYLCHASCKHTKYLMKDSFFVLAHLFGIIWPRCSPTLILLLSTLPSRLTCNNRNGWLGVKHQVTYLLTYLLTCSITVSKLSPVRGFLCVWLLCYCKMLWAPTLYGRWIQQWSDSRPSDISVDWWIVDDAEVGYRQLLEVQWFAGIQSVHLILLSQSVSDLCTEF